MNRKEALPEMALSGVRIVDFGQGAIDPLTTSFLADFGAEVIKIESFDKLDFVRTSEHFPDEKRDPDRNLAFARYNQNKYGCLINLKLPAGVELAKRIVAISDVVIENFTVDVIHRLGLDYEVLRKVKPDIIMLSACFGGQSGPYRNFRGQGSVIAALQGFDDLTGWPDRAPASPGVAFGDHYLPWVWSTIILAALRYRRETGKGMFIDGSSFEGCLDVLDTSIADYSVNGRVLKRRGNRSATAAPHGVYRCKGDDRWVAIAVSKDEEWQCMCKTLGDLPWPQDREFSTAAGRLARADELDALVEGWTVNQVAENVMLRLQEAGVAAEVVNNAADMHSDPQLAFRGHFWETDEVGMEPFTFEAPSSRLSLTPATFRRRGPFLGEHNDYVFLDLLGMSTEEFASLIEQKVIY